MNAVNRLFSLCAVVFALCAVALVAIAASPPDPPEGNGVPLSHYWTAAKMTQILRWSDPNDGASSLTVTVLQARCIGVEEPNVSKGVRRYRYFRCPGLYRIHWSDPTALGAGNATPQHRSIWAGPARSVRDGICVSLTTLKSLRRTCRNS